MLCGECVWGGTCVWVGVWVGVHTCKGERREACDVMCMVMCAYVYCHVNINPHTPSTCISYPLHLASTPHPQQFLPVAQDLEQNNWTRFTPHYKIWRCPDSYKDSEECRKQCIHKGRYCSPDPESDKFDGKDVVEENLRQLCVFKLANASGQSWLWWDYATRFADQCAMDTSKYGKECAEQVGIVCVCVFDDGHDEDNGDGEETTPMLIISHAPTYIQT